MRPFDYASPGTIDETLTLLAMNQAGAADAVRPLAGGTDLLTLMKADIVSPVLLVDIKRVVELDNRIEDRPDGLVIGALATLSQLEGDPLVRARSTALAEAAAVAASPQLRNMATIGGNLLQRPRCWYYRNPLVHCWLNGGAGCPARDGENANHALFGADPCVAVHPSDLATALVALDAEVRLRGRSGERLLPIGQFFSMPDDDRRTETVLAGDELVVSIRIPPAVPETRSTYLKAMDRKTWAFALVGVAAAVRIDGGRIADARLVLGGVSPVPWRAPEAERLLIGAEPADALFARVADEALVGATPLSDNAYKIPLAKTLVRRALAKAAANQAAGPAD
ncbi:MAG TPA: xanthine dehydrogenase family protein subunit M [Thermomicrobiales bacterium]|nr:xanthine dehydrogenase family protein subunit M [Thermomicrobiales bacterium]